MVSYAAPVSPNLAKKVAYSFLSTRADLQGFDFTSVNLLHTEQAVSINDDNNQEVLNCFYIMTMGNKFVIVSADNIVQPVLAYAVGTTIDLQNIPESVQKWLDGYKGQIRDAIVYQATPTQQTNTEWALYSTGNNLGNSRQSAIVPPLMNTTWSQSPYYNAMCPGGSVTGCVATAMAQVMKFWNYPATGTGFHSYNHDTYGTLSANFGNTSYQWSSMPNNVTSSNSAVATLMYHCGVSVDMSYSPESSGAFVISSASPVTHCAEYAFKTYFGYDNTLQGKKRSSYTESQWINLLKTELDAGRPVLYAGFGTGGGHAFVCDGYDNNNYFHFNWGWGGAYDGNFTVNALNPDGVGTGGGSGGYNDGQQAIIGVKPPAGTSQTSDLALNNYVTPSQSTIYYGGAFDVTTNIVNNGTATFSGDYAVAAFDANGVFVDFVQTLTGNSLQAGYTYTNDLTFSTTGMLSLLPGTYYLAAYYRPTGGQWNVIADNGSYSNIAQIDVINPNDMELSEAMSVNPGTAVVQGAAMSVDLNVQNDGSATFYGDYSLDLYSLDGTWVEEIQVLSETNGLPSGYTYNSSLTFATTAITAAPGTYLLALMHNPSNTGWQLTGSSYFQNPIMITVQAADLNPDIYEVNNTVATSYVLPLTYSGNTATKKTTGSNIHTNADVDFYKIALPAGSSYTVTARIHDAYNSGNGSTYSVDGLFSYSKNSTTWSSTYDDVMPQDITMPNGGTLYFKVAPYFAGEKGTYLLDLKVVKSGSTAIDEIDPNGNVQLYPNPAKDVVTVDWNSFNESIKSISLIDLSGRQLFTSDVSNGSKNIEIQLQAYASGNYFIRFDLDNKQWFVKKLVISK